jgi:hypothetical protein
MAENTISPELLDRINQFAGAGAVSDQEMMTMQGANPTGGFLVSPEMTSQDVFSAGETTRRMREATPEMGDPLPLSRQMGESMQIAPQGFQEGAVSDQESGFMQGLQELEQQKQMSDDPDEIQALDSAITRLVTGANAPLGDLARQVQAAGTGEDTQLAHLSPGEIVLPAEFMADAELEGMIEKKFRDSGIDPAQAVAGVGIASLNQMTGLEEFGFFKKIGKALKKIAKPLIKVAQFVPGPWQPIAAIADKAITVHDVVKGKASPLNLLSVAGPLRVGPGIGESISKIGKASASGSFLGGLGETLKDIPGALRSGIGSLASDPIGSVKGLFKSANPADYTQNAKGEYVNKITGEVGLPFGAKVPSDLLTRSGGGIQSLTKGVQGLAFGTEGIASGVQEVPTAAGDMQYQDAAGNLYSQKTMIDAGLVDPNTLELKRAAVGFSQAGAGGAGAGGAGAGAGAAQPQGSAFSRFLGGLLPGAAGQGLAGGLGSLAGLGLAGGAAFGLGKLAMEEARRDKGVPLTPLTTMDAGGRYNIEAEIARRMGRAAPNPVEFGLQPRMPTLSGGQAGPRKEAVTSQYVQGAAMGGAMQPMYAMAYANGGDVAMEDFERMNGYIDGPGTETSDDIPAMLSDGEFVMTGQAVRGAGSFELNEEPNGILTLVPSASESRERGTQLMYQMMDVFGRYANATS